MSYCQVSMESMDADELDGTEESIRSGNSTPREQRSPDKSQLDSPKTSMNALSPGMLHGKVVRSPAVGARVVSVDTGSVAGLPGNVQVVVRNHFVGVVADTQWDATQAATAFVTWSAGATLPDQNTLYTWLQQQPSADSYTVNSGDTDQTIQKAASKISAQYLHP